MIELTSQARQAYEEMVNNLETNLPEQQEVENGNEQETESNTEHFAEEPEYSKTSSHFFVCFLNYWGPLIISYVCVCFLVKVWKKMLEKDFNHQFLPFEKFSSLAISSDSDT